MSRGRPTENDVALDKWTMTCYEFPSKPELGSKSVWHFDRSKNPHGCWKVDHTPAKGEKLPKVKVNKTQTYGGVPVAMVFKTSKNSNAKTKIKVWNNTNIDYILTQDKLPGVPEKAVILELGVGENNIKTWKSKYSL
jgi:hypothetical protein